SGFEVANHRIGKFGRAVVDQIRAGSLDVAIAHKGMDREADAHNDDDPQHGQKNSQKPELSIQLGSPAGFLLPWLWSPLWLHGFRHVGASNPISGAWDSVTK